MIAIHACPRGHRYRTNVLHPGERTNCPRCDQREMVELAYGDCQRPPRSCRLLTFRTEAIVCYEELVDLLRCAGPYNHFLPEVVAEEIRPVFPRLSSVEFGREASPVLYAHIPHWTHQAIAWNGSGMGERIPTDERNDIAREFLEAMRRAEADELSDERYAARAWWD